MDVHHHSHTADPPDSYRDHRGRKKWTHYFWEFFMLFLAVTLGFFVENQREHIIESKRAKKFIASLVEDLKRDTATFQRTYFVNDTAMQMMDSLISLLHYPDYYSSKAPQIYYLARMAIGINIPYIPTDRTFNQMKSSGNLRLIENHEIADSISNYYYRIEQLKILTDTWKTAQDEYSKNIALAFDASVFQQMFKDMFEKRQHYLQLPTNKILALPVPSSDTHLSITQNSETVKALIGSLHFLYTRNHGLQRNAVSARTSAIHLIGMLQQHYHLKN